MLPAAAHSADRLNAAAIGALLRWDIAAVLPDARGQTQDTTPQITQLRSFRLAGVTEPDLLLVCATLVFDEPDTDPTGVVLIYALDQRTGPRPLGSPFFHGLNWARGRVPLADACDAAQAGTNWNAVALGGDP